MDKQQYIRRVVKRIKVTERTRARIEADLETEIHTRQEQGLSLAEAIAQCGAPQAVADGFNETYRGTPQHRQYYVQQALKIGAIALLILAVLLVSAHILLNQAQQSALRAMDDASGAIIGGADGPTRIYVTSRAIPLLYMNNGLILAGGAALVLGTAACIALLMLRKRY